VGRPPRVAGRARPLAHRRCGGERPPLQASGSHADGDGRIRSRPCGRQPQAGRGRATGRRTASTTTTGPPRSGTAGVGVIVSPAQGSRTPPRGTTSPASPPKTPGKAPQREQRQPGDDPGRTATKAPRSSPRRRPPPRLHDRRRHRREGRRRRTPTRPRISRSAAAKAPTPTNAPCPSEGRPANSTAKFSPTPARPHTAPPRDRSPNRIASHHRTANPRPDEHGRDRPGRRFPSRRCACRNGEGRSPEGRKGCRPRRLPRNARGHSARAATETCTLPAAVTAMARSSGTRFPQAGPGLSPPTWSTRHRRFPPPRARPAANTVF